MCVCVFVRFPLLGLDKRKAKVAGWGRRFTSGKYTTDNGLSNCMTTEEGPVDSRFEYCNTKKVNISYIGKFIKTFLKYRK